ncbi:MAG TPA: prolyl oligopeptidase family serine peptidase, partial [Bacillota bacterium]|nr:prolyl oligopeptidase family serine peptidase [Bacillota bacterium]
MRTLNQLLLTAALLSLTACTATKPMAKATPPTTQSAKHFKFQKSQMLEANYLLYLPQDYDAKSGKRWPLMLFLHGAGERGTNVWKVATHGPPKNVKNTTNFPFIVVSPQCPEGQIWSNDILLALLDEISSTYAVDTNRVYLTGLSMGGYGTWRLGLAHPERFAAIVPICGGGEMITVLLSSWERAQALKTLGVWAFHGGKDPVVPLAESQRMVDALKKVGVQEVKFTVYPEASHDSWTETYQNPELYQWLLQHER